MAKVGWVTNLYKLELIILWHIVYTDELTTTISVAVSRVQKELFLLTRHHFLTFFLDLRSDRIEWASWKNKSAPQEVSQNRQPKTRRGYILIC